VHRSKLLGRLETVDGACLSEKFQARSVRARHCTMIRCSRR
jgi:hypothetical protein